MEKIDLTRMDKQELVNTINRLVYENYKYNRQRSPDFTVDQWAKVFGMDAYLMELKYQEENG